ncbi:dopamine receptor 2-like [Mya arenaria]|uniref:dopamine receptor 2-like n=1 Tax=Mya arenaria TaxID=6604 RepID=UPI0022E389BB|nr:dopamine receptor 2-like [Mya arenaria]
MSALQDTTWLPYSVNASESWLVLSANERDADVIPAGSTYNFSFSNLSFDHTAQMFANTTDTVYASTKHPMIGVVLVMFSFITVLGNILVIAAVVKELYLRTVTNVSLALADVMVGGIVMPFSISYELNNQVWYSGIAWCDLWHSFDVLGSTASILNLCIISLDRYWAITDPIAYPNRMTPCRVSILITFVWLCSAGISFPAIAWWKAVTPPGIPSDQCVFTEDCAYLIFSSMVSFYFPTIIMILVFIQIYRAAGNQRKSIESGTKVLTSNQLFGTSGVMTLRIHRGGMAKLQSPAKSHETTPFRKKSESEEEDTSLASNAQTPVHSASHSLTNHNDHNELHHHHLNHNQDEHSHNQKPMKFITKRLRQLALSKKLSKLAKEQKAAKTLGIIVGVFIICWMPFFVVNVLLGICGASCVGKLDIIRPVFTWFGYINSGVNPIIYALSMRDFRRAFGRIIFCCCPKYRF